MSQHNNSTRRKHSADGSQNTPGKLLGGSAITPTHYEFPNGFSVIDLTENLNFCRGNVVKYVARAGRKEPEKELEDLKKAAWYLAREIARLERRT